MYLKTINFYNFQRDLPIKEWDALVASMVTIMKVLVTATATTLITLKLMVMEMTIVTDMDMETTMIMFISNHWIPTSLSQINMTSITLCLRLALDTSDLLIGSLENGNQTEMMSLIMIESISSLLITGSETTPCKYKILPKITFLLCVCL